MSDGLCRTRDSTKQRVPGYERLGLVSILGTEVRQRRQLELVQLLLHQQTETRHQRG